MIPQNEIRTIIINECSKILIIINKEIANIKKRKPKPNTPAQIHNNARFLAMQKIKDKLESRLLKLKQLNP